MPYMQTYKKDWEKLSMFNGWLFPSSMGVTYALCGICNRHINVSSGKTALVRHAKGRSHIIKMEKPPEQLKLTDTATMSTMGKEDLLQLEGELLNLRKEELEIRKQIALEELHRAQELTQAALRKAALEEEILRAQLPTPNIIR